MKLVRKLSLAISLGVALVLGFRVWVRAIEERDDYRRDEQRDHEVLGAALATSVEAVWVQEGAERALALIRSVDHSDVKGSVRFVWADGTGVDARPALVPEILPKLDQSPVTRLLLDGSVPRLVTYAPIDVPGERDGAIELFEELSGESRAVRMFLQSLVVTTAMIEAFCVIIIFAFGVVFVARPLRKLVEKAERIGRGDLTGPLSLGRNDEIRDVALAMNEMCERLQEARSQAEREATARLEALEQLRHADRLRTVGELASGIAHQMGTPLNVVRVRGSMIASGEVSEQRMREIGGIIVEQVDRVGDTIRQLLDFARRQQPTLTSCDVGRLVNQSIRLVEPLAGARNVQLRLEPSQEPLVLALDASQIHQVLTNLLVNALQVTPTGETIDVRVERLEGEVAITVQDRGEGIPVEQLDQVFEPFFTTKRAGEGTGLGLSVADGIVREHGGRITVESVRGQGAVFRVFLPLRQAA
jgi:two-component system NtrC family sensor kinase